MKKTSAISKSSIYIDQLYSPLGQCLLFDLLKEKSRGVTVEQIITNKKQHTFHHKKKTHNLGGIPKSNRKSQSGLKGTSTSKFPTKGQRKGWSVHEFNLSNLKESPLLRFLENNDPIFSWKAEIFKDKTGFYGSKKLDDLVRIRNGGEDSPFWEDLDFNFAKKLKEARKPLDQVKSSYRQIFKKDWGGGFENILSVKMKDVKSVLRIIKNCQAFVFELKVSNLKLVEKFMIVLRHMKDDGLSRKLILISDIMTWGESASKEIEGESFVEKKEKAWVQDILKSVEHKITFMDLKGLGTAPEIIDQNVVSEEVIKHENDLEFEKIASLRSERINKDVEVRFEQTSNNESEPTSVLKSYGSNRNWRKATLKKFQHMLEKNKENLEKSSGINENLGRRNGRFIRRVGEPQANQFGQVKDEQERIKIRVYESLKKNLYGQADMNQIFGLNYSEKIKGMKKTYGWKFWSEYKGKYLQILSLL